VPAGPEWETAELPGILVYTPRIVEDDRGFFVKTFHEKVFADAGIDFKLREEFYSSSRKNVLRGMHFQFPPFEHAKLVTCLSGQVLDVLVDLRRQQPSYGRSCSIELSQRDRRVLYIPPGFAHGFVSLSEGALVHYKTDAVYSPDHDTGIRWNSFGFKWPVSTPITSRRDSGFPSLAEFDSPF
jgi:dTDP-4-dehydrorhamnose 3,5-epimerase